MKKTLKDAYRSISYNFKQLFLFELAYRILGLLIVFPILTLLFELSVTLSGYSYITNQLLITYLLRPTTIILLFILLTILALYVMVELIFLSIIFDYGYHDRNLTFEELIIFGLKKTYDMYKTYHIKIIIPAFIFFIVVELLHIVGIAQTVNLPIELIIFINQNVWFQFAFGLLVFIVIFLFIETAFHIHLYSVEKLSFKEVLQESNVLLKKKRLEMIGEFMLINILFNAILYGFYILIIVIVGYVITWIRGSAYALSAVLTILYSVYSVFGFVATITLIPINYALVSSWYYEGREKQGKVYAMARKKKITLNLGSKKSKLIIAGTIILLLVINLSSVLSVLANPRSQLEILNYAEIIAHRGASKDAPENTLASIQLAMDQYADAIEIDIRETNDGVPILMHDATLGRTTNDPYNRRVESTDYAYIETLDAGSWFRLEFQGEKVPTLEEVLELTAGKVTLFLELKNYSPSLENQVMSLLESYDMIQDVVILSFSRDQLSRIKSMNEEVETLLLISTFFGDIQTIVQSEEINHFGLSVHFYDRNQSFVDQAKQQGKKVYVWAIKDEETMDRMIELDADGLITDRPLLAREFVYSKNTQSLLVDVLRRLFMRN